MAASISSDFTFAAARPSRVVGGGSDYRLASSDASDISGYWAPAGILLVTHDNSGNLAALTTQSSPVLGMRSLCLHRRLRSSVYIGRADKRRPQCFSAGRKA